jgi:hypothetical protein
MAGNATITESTLLMNRTTGKEREVDVVIMGETAGHKVTIAVEATSRGRRADVPWVEQMLGKYADLPTDKLVLVSEGGFTDQATTLAEARGAVVLSPKDLGERDPAHQVVNKLRSIWPKTVSLTPDTAKIYMRHPDGKLQWFKALPDHLVFLETGEELGTVLECVRRTISESWQKIAADLDFASISEDLEKPFLLIIEGPAVLIDGQRRHPFAKFEAEGQTPEFHRIVAIEVGGTDVIKVAEVPLKHARLGEVLFAHGESELEGRRALFVVTEDEEGGMMTIRLRD